MPPGVPRASRTPPRRSAYRGRRATTVADVHVYPRALSSTEVSALHWPTAEVGPAPTPTRAARARPRPRQPPATPSRRTDRHRRTPPQDQPAETTQEITPASTTSEHRRVADIEAAHHRRIPPESRHRRSPHQVRRGSARDLHHRASHAAEPDQNTTSRRGLRRAASCHGRVTNPVDTLSTRDPEMGYICPLRTGWTAVDGFYDMCHVVPSEGPRIRTGASSGPSKRYCRVFGGVSLTPQTLSRLTDAPITGERRVPF